jgi:hypothetical protein
MQPERYCLIRYLEAKRTVDDRALSQRAWQRLLIAHQLDVLGRP